MVQILPTRTNIGSQIGQGLGSGLAQGMERRNQYQFQRGNLQKALQGVKSLGNQPGANAFDLATSLMEATAGIPGAEKYVGALFPMLLQQMSAQQAQGIPGMEMNPQGVAQTPGMTGEQPPPVSFGEQASPSIQQGTEGKKSPSRDVADEVYTGISNGTFPHPDQPLLGEGQAILESALGKNPKIFSPGAIQNAELEGRKRGLGSTWAELLRNFNEDVQKQTQFQLGNVQARASVAHQLEEEQKRFGNYVDERNPGLKPDDKRVFLEMADTPQAREKTRPEDRYKEAEQLFHRYDSLVHQLERDYPSGLVPGQGREKKMRDLSNHIQWMVGVGQRDKAKSLLTEKLGFGDADSEEIINPLNTSEKGLLTNVKPFTPYDKDIRYVPESDPDAPFGYESPEMKEYSRKVGENAATRKKEIDAYKPRLKASINEGTGKNPGTSLAVARKYAMDSTGMTWEEFNDVIQDMIKDGQLKLDPYQRQELIKMGHAPYRGMADVFMDRR